MKANLVEVKKYKIACPACGTATKTFAHLKPGETFGDWHCDHCGQGYKGTIDTDGHPDIELTESYSKRIRTLVLLELPELIEDMPVYFVVFGSQWVRKKGDTLSVTEIEDGDRYYYEEHTCPKNWLRCHVVHGEDCDPHGLFRHVQTIPMPTKEQLISMGLKENGWDIDWTEGDSNFYLDVPAHAIRALFSRSYPNNRTVTLDGEVRKKGVITEQQVGSFTSFPAIVPIETPFRSEPFLTRQIVDSVLIGGISQFEPLPRETAEIAKQQLPSEISFEVNDVQVGLNIFYSPAAALDIERVKIAGNVFEKLMSASPGFFTACNECLGFIEVPMMLLRLNSILRSFDDEFRSITGLSLMGLYKHLTGIEYSPLLPGNKSSITVVTTFEGGLSNERNDNTPS